MSEIGILGPNGNLGKHLVDIGCVPLPVDVTDSKETEKTIANFYGKTIINCAAYTNVDGAEDDKEYEKAIQVNGVGAGRVALYCVAHGKKLIHISTDYVFDGKRGPYVESNIPRNPVNKYGFSKFGGEVATRFIFDSGNCVVRTTGLYGGHKHDFTKLVIKSLSENKVLMVTDELMGNQTFIPHLAEALIELAIKGKPINPVIHISSKEVVSRYEFAKMIAEQFDLNPELLLPVTNDEISSWVAKRPTKGGLRTFYAGSNNLPIYSISDGLKELYGR